MSLSRMFDASSPPVQPYPGCQAVAGYIGGSTPHVWTPAEWQRFSTFRQFPIYVGSGRTNGAADGGDAVREALRLGWAAHHPTATLRAIVLDMEAETDPAYINAFADVVFKAGFCTVVYESETVMNGNPVREGVWVALWDGEADIPPGAHILAHQYKPDVPWDNTQVDLSMVSSDMMVHGGEGPRHG